MMTRDWLKKDGTWSSHLSTTQKTLRDSDQGQYGFNLFNYLQSKKCPQEAEVVRAHINEALQLDLEREQQKLLPKRPCRLS